MTRTFVIAEVAAIHEGDLSTALRCVHTAAAVGADAVKFQYCSSPETLAERRHAQDYLWAYRHLAFPTPWLTILSETARERRIEFMCTVYLPEDVATIAPYVTRFKLASFEAGAADLKQALAPYRRTHQIIASEGMGSFASAFDDMPFKILHCVSAYPAPPEEMNLRVITRGIADGLSDHTRHPWTGALAVAAGATILERHLRLSGTNPQNPDYAVASDPEMFREYVDNVRLCEAMLGDGNKRAMESERPMMAYRVIS